MLASDGDAYAKGVAYTCNFIDDSEENNMTFFVLSSREDTVTLISGSDLGYAAWSADGSSHIDEPEDKQAVTAKAALAERTANWASVNGGKLNDTQMSMIKLPTADQILGAYTGGIMPTWLYGWTKAPISSIYWTSTPAGTGGLDGYASLVTYEGYLDGYYCFVNDSAGIRPVITLSKSNV